MNSKQDNEIQNKVSQHLEKCLSNLDREWFVICACGSMNYGLWDELSDVDTKLIVFPTFEEIIFHKQPISKTKIFSNGEHCDIKDIREYFKVLQKQNINFMEILFTNYWIVNDKYIDIWMDLRRHAEEIARENPYQAMRCYKGMAHEKAHSFFTRIAGDAPSAEFCYDSKTLSHILRLYDFAYKYSNQINYSKCLIPDKADWLMDIKRRRVNFSYEEAANMVKDTIEKIDKLECLFNKYHENIMNEEAKEILEFNLKQAMIRNLKTTIQGA